RALDHNVAVQFREVTSLFDHPGCVGTDGFSADRTIHDRADLQQLILKTIAFLRDQRWIRRNTVQDARCRRFANLVQVGRIQEEFHNKAPKLNSVSYQSISRMAFSPVRIGQEWHVMTQGPLARLRARNEWKFFAVLPKVHPSMGGTWWLLILLRGVL